MKDKCKLKANTYYISVYLVCALRSFFIANFLKPQLNLF